MTATFIAAPHWDIQIQVEVDGRAIGRFPIVCWEMDVERAQAAPWWLEDDGCLRSVRSVYESGEVDGPFGPVRVTDDSRVYTALVDD